MRATLQLCASVLTGSSCLQLSLFTFALPALRTVFGASDPFCMQTDFPWLVLAPLLVALQCGLVAALVSTVAGSVAAVTHAAWASQALPASAGSALCAALLIAASAGLARDAVHEATTMTRAEAAAAVRELARLRRAYHLLERAHEALAEGRAISHYGVARALESARLALDARDGWPDLGRVVLDLLGEHAEVQAAALYVVRPGGRTLEPEPVARLGAPGARAARHPLLLRALECGDLVCWRDLAGSDQDVLAAVPLRVAAGHCLGVIALHQLGFGARTDEALELILELSAHLADEVSKRLGAPGAGLESRAAGARLPERTAPPRGPAAAVAARTAAAELRARLLMRTPEPGASRSVREPRPATPRLRGESAAVVRLDTTIPVFGAPGLRAESQPVRSPRGGAVAAPVRHGGAK